MPSRIHRQPTWTNNTSYKGEREREREERERERREREGERGRETRQFLLATPPCRPLGRIHRQPTWTNNTEREREREREREGEIREGN